MINFLARIPSGIYGFLVFVTLVAIGDSYFKKNTKVKEKLVKEDKRQLTPQTNILLELSKKRLREQDPKLYQERFPNDPKTPDENVKESLNDEEIEETTESNLPEINLEHNWQCDFCRVTVQKSEMPEKNTCRVAEEEEGGWPGRKHRWEKL